MDQVSDFLPVHGKDFRISTCLMATWTYQFSHADFGTGVVFDAKAVIILHAK